MKKVTSQAELELITKIVSYFYIFIKNNLTGHVCCEAFNISNRLVSVVEFHDPTLSIGKVFGQESTVVKWNYQILGLHQVTVRQKLGVILVIKWFKNWSQQKNAFYKKGGP